MRQKRETKEACITTEGAKARAQLVILPTMGQSRDLPVYSADKVTKMVCRLDLPFQVLLKRREQIIKGLKEECLARYSPLSLEVV